MTDQSANNTASTDVDQETKKRRLMQAGIAIIALLLLLALVLIISPAQSMGWRPYVFVAAFALLASAIGAIGWGISGRPAGVYIDNRNRMSLSKLQACAWTVVVLAAFATAGAFNIHQQIAVLGSVKGLAIIIPGELLLAMGISATSLVATPGLLSIKSQEKPKDEDVNSAVARLGPGAGNNGKLFTRNDPAKAVWSDLFTGEEIGNAGSPDLGKIQQAFITLLLLGTYSAYIFAAFAGAAKTIDQLPVLDKSFVWLLGISHASYLAYKAAPHTSSDNDKSGKSS